jgi:hypothetical protein
MRFCLCSSGSGTFFLFFDAFAALLAELEAAALLGPNRRLKLELEAGILLEPNW